MKVKLDINAGGKPASFESISKINIVMSIDAGIDSRTARALDVEIERSVYGPGKGDNPPELVPFSTISAESIANVQTTIEFSSSLDKKVLGRFRGAGNIRENIVSHSGNAVQQSIALTLARDVSYQVGDGAQSPALKIA